MDEFMSIEEAAAYLDRTKRTIYRLIEHGLIEKEIDNTISKANLEQYCMKKGIRFCKSIIKGYDSGDGVIS